MNKKEFVEYDELKMFVDSLLVEKKWAIDVRQNTDTGVYLALWTEHKSYTTAEGTTIIDEVWTNRNGEMTCVQDLDPDHAKNILRMLLRQEREQRVLLEEIARKMIADTDEVDDSVPEPLLETKPMLH